MKDKLNNIPLWAVNLITVLSGITTIVTPIVNLFIALRFGIAASLLIFVVYIISVCFIAILWLRLKKYRSLAQNRMEITSERFFKSMEVSRDLLFDTQHCAQKGMLSIDGLSSSYKEKMSFVLDDLCSVMESYTGKSVTACVKALSVSADDSNIDVDNAKVVTFCRSNNSELGRGAYEKKKEIRVIDNTDFLEIIDDKVQKDYFYQGDLNDYKKKRESIGLEYINSNNNWNSSYRGTVVVPIQIENDKIYHQKNGAKYRVIGFLCVDSKFIDTFDVSQESYNVNIIKAYANILYIMLSQYNQYLEQLTKV